MNEGQMARPLVIWGAGGHACVLRDAAEASGAYKVLAFIDNTAAGDAVLDEIPVLGGPDCLSRASKLAPCIHVAIGAAAARRKCLDRAATLGFELATIVHPGAHVARRVELGEGAAVLAGAVVNPHAVVGRGCIVNSAAVVEHHCRLGDAAHIAPGARLGGHAAVGAETWIGIGAILRDRITVGAFSMIGAGATVVKDLPDRVVAIGTPARIIRIVADDASAHSG